MRRTAVLGSFLIVATASICAAAAIEEPTSVAFYVLEHWDSGVVGIEVETLEVVETSCAREFRRLFVRGHDGAQLYIDRVLEPPKGRTRIIVHADEGSWSVGLTDETDRHVSVETPSAYGGLLLWQQPSQVEGDWLLTRSIILNDRPLGEVHSTLQDGEINQRLIELLRENGGSKQLMDAIPAGLTDVVASMHSLVNSDVGRGTTLAYLRPLFSLLAADEPETAPGDPRLARARWRKSPAGGGAGSALIHGRARDLVAAFEAISSPLKPLGDDHDQEAGGGCPARAE